MNDHQAETFKSLVPLSTEALKSLLLLNGGAVVALLAYLGQATKRAELAQRMCTPLACFVIGLVLGVLAFGGAYLTQLALFNESAQGERFSGLTHRVWLRSAFTLGLLSLASFAVGAFSSIHALAQP